MKYDVTLSRSPVKLIKLHMSKIVLHEPESINHSRPGVLRGLSELIFLTYFELEGSNHSLSSDEISSSSSFDEQIKSIIRPSEIVAVQSYRDVRFMQFHASQIRTCPFPLPPPVAERQLQENRTSITDLPSPEPKDVSVLSSLLRISKADHSQLQGDAFTKCHGPWSLEPKRPSISQVEIFLDL